MSPQKKTQALNMFGIRLRRLLYLLNSKAQIKCIVPVRKFETYFFFKSKSKFGNTNLSKKNIKEAWEQWYHKTELFVSKKEISK